MSSLQEITRLKQRVEEAASERARQEGALKERLRALKDICGTDDIDKAEALLNKQEKEVIKSEEALSEALTKLKEKYAELLD